jgi:hypothetical protein
MRYFVFDLDETLAEMYPMYYFIASLRMMVDEDRSHLLYIPADFHQTLDKAYRFFVHHVLQAEKRPSPLGLLRPGILEVMKALQRLREEGVIKGVMIYSNNSNPRLLEFIADVIHEHVKSNQLIKKCVHLYHPYRREERSQHPRGYHKTWEGVKNSLIQGAQASSNVSIQDVYFFDDLEHEDLQRALGNHYIKVPPYTKHASFTELAHLYHKSLLDANIDKSLFVTLTMDLLHLRTPRYIDENPTINDLIQWFEWELDQTPPIHLEKEVEIVKGKEEGIQQMWAVIESIRPPSLQLKRGKRVRKGVSTRKLRRRTIRK